MAGSSFSGPSKADEASTTRAKSTLKAPAEAVEPFTQEPQSTFQGLEAIRKVGKV